jgi:hypothetical protein
MGLSPFPATTWPPSGTASQSSIYARVGMNVATPPLAGMLLPEVVKTVLTRPMNATELAGAILEAGYKTSQANSAFRHPVGKEVWEGPFRKAGGKWSAD